MKRLLLATAFAIVASICVSDNASAQQQFGFGFQPFGFYQPYGARYGTSLRTPPYFALNPPVYYGARYARPYGASPFASPPVVSAPSSYRARLRTQFQSNRHANPYVSQSLPLQPADTFAEKGDVRTNPFMDEPERFAVH